MPAPLPRPPAPTPSVFKVGLREISQLFRGRVVHCRGAYLVPADELLMESAQPGGIDVVAVPAPVRAAAAPAPGRFQHPPDSIYHRKEAQSA